MDNNWVVVDGAFRNGNQTAQKNFNHGPTQYFLPYTFTQNSYEFAIDPRAVKRRNTISE